MPDRISIYYNEELPGMTIECPTRLEQELSKAISEACSVPQVYGPKKDNPEVFEIEITWEEISERLYETVIGFTDKHGFNDGGE